MIEWLEKYSTAEDLPGIAKARIRKDEDYPRPKKTEKLKVQWGCRLPDSMLRQNGYDEFEAPKDYTPIPDLTDREEGAGMSEKGGASSCANQLSPEPMQHIPGPHVCQRDRCISFNPQPTLIYDLCRVLLPMGIPLIIQPLTCQGSLKAQLLRTTRTKKVRLFSFPRNGVVR